MKEQSENKKPLAYYRVMIKNADTDEFRKNAYDRDHCFPVGMDVENLAGTDTQVYVCKDTQDWLSRIENPVLAKELKALSEENCIITASPDIFTEYADLLRVPEVADLLGVSDKTVYTLIKNEDIDSVKPGRAYLVPKTSIIRYCKIYL